jgi:hypothetical protein
MAWCRSEALGAAHINAAEVSLPRISQQRDVGGRQFVSNHPIRDVQMPYRRSIASYICKLKEAHMRLSHSASAITIGAWLAIGVPMSASANVITDWDEKAVAVVMPAGAAGVSQQVYTARRIMGMVHAAMFDAVNSIERRYQPYLVQLPANPATSRDAAAAAAAAAVLAAIDAKSVSAMKEALASYLASFPDDDAASGRPQTRRGGCCQDFRGPCKRWPRCGR